MGTVEYKHRNFSIRYNAERSLFKFRASKGHKYGYIDLFDKEAIVICHTFDLNDEDFSMEEADMTDKCFTDNYDTVLYSMLSLIACAYTFKRTIVTKDTELSSEHLIYKDIVLGKDTDKNIELLHSANVDIKKLVHEIRILAHLVSIAHYGMSLNAHKVYSFTPRNEQSKKVLFKFHGEILWTGMFYAFNSVMMDLQFVYVYMNSDLPDVTEEVDLVYTLDAFNDALSKVSRLEYNKLRLIGYELKDQHDLMLCMRTMFALKCAN